MATDFDPIKAAAERVIAATDALLAMENLGRIIEREYAEIERTHNLTAKVTAWMKEYVAERQAHLNQLREAAELAAGQQ